MMDLPLNVDVYCQDGRAGRSTNVIFNPVSREVTHLVVAISERPHTEYLVPARLFGESTPASINLHCTTEELKAGVPFNDAEFVEVDIPQYKGGSHAWPLVTTRQKKSVVTHHHIPLGELAIRRGAEVDATDGRVGQVEEFLVDDQCHITHLVLGKGHFWGHKDVAIPVSEVAQFGENHVRLKLDKASVNALPTISIHH